MSVLAISKILLRTPGERREGSDERRAASREGKSFRRYTKLEHEIALDG